MVKPMPPYFLVRVLKKEQKERMEKIGRIYLHPSHIFMTRNMQCGEIMAIGRKAQECFPTAQIGHTLLFHHFIEAQDTYFFVDSDDQYNYYVVNTSLHHNGQNNQGYAVWDGQNIIPHPEYFFLDCEQPKMESKDVELIEGKNGLILFKEWKENRQDKERRLEKLQDEVKSLAKTTPMTDQLKWAIEAKEAEMNEISRSLSKTKYDIYRLIAINDDFNARVRETFDMWLRPGDLIYMWDIACQTKVEFNRREYIVAKSIHFAMPYMWAEYKHQQFKKLELSTAH